MFQKIDLNKNNFTLQKIINKFKINIYKKFIKI